MCSLEDIKEKFPVKFTTTASNEPFLRFNDWLDPETKKQLLVVFISDHGRWVLSRAVELYVDGTFQTSCENFCQVYFVMAKMADRTTVPVVYGLLPNKTASTYKRFWEIICNVVDFEPGHPSRVMSDFEKAMQSTLKQVFPLAVHKVHEENGTALNVGSCCMLNDG